MRAVVVETNVIVVANRKSPQAGPDCILACVDALEHARQEIVVIDSSVKILDEYRKHASLSGQPGIGDAFIKWLWNNQANPQHCERVDVTPKTNDPDDFEEFPNDADLAKFDRSDRKFVAVALTSRHRPKILNATDSDWWIFCSQLKKHNIVIKFLCPDLFTKVKKW